MKQACLLFILACFASSALAKVDEAAVAEVKAGRRTEAHAAWWGFDPADSTAALQAAIGSGARKVILDDMGSPWITGPLELAGDQELALAPGVVLQARRGAYKGAGDCLLSASGKKNVAITGGKGSALKMWRGDYARAPYSKSEHRHAVSIKSCAGVKITGLSIIESGGDGIYLGVSRPGVANTDVEIRNVVCDRNYRQGISVISAERMLIENTILRDTSGTAPMAGIDFEPNDPSEKLAEIVMRNCLVENNAGDGYTFYLKNQTTKSAPMSVRFENCRSVGNRHGFRYANGAGHQGDSVRGKMDVIDCSFEGSRGPGISVDGKPAEGCPIRFERCRVANAATEGTAAPIQITSGVEDEASNGGIEFVDCVVVDDLPGRHPLGWHPLGWHDLAGGVKLAGVTGKLTLVRAGQPSLVTLDRKLIESWFPAQAFKEFAPFKAAGVEWKPLAPEVRAAGGYACPVRLREKSEYLVWAPAGQEVALTLRLRRVGTSGAKMTVALIAPDGMSRKLAPMAGESEKTYTFKSVKAGAFHVQCEPGRATVQVVKCSHPVCIYRESGRMHLLGTAGRLYFQVPAGVEEFAVRVGAGGTGESVKATVLDAAGKAVEEKDNIEGHQFLMKRGKGAGAEIWSIRLDRPSRGTIEDYYLQLQGIAPVLAAGPDGLIVNRE